MVIVYWQVLLWSAYIFYRHTRLWARIIGRRRRTPQFQRPKATVSLLIYLPHCSALLLFISMELNRRRDYEVTIFGRQLVPVPIFEYLTVLIHGTLMRILL